MYFIRAISYVFVWGPQEFGWRSRKGQSQTHLSIARITQMEIVVACVDSCSSFKDGATCKRVCTDRGIIGQVGKALSTGLEYPTNSIGDASISRWTENTNYSLEKNWDLTFWDWYSRCQMKGSPRKLMAKIIRAKSLIGFGTKGKTEREYVNGALISSCALYKCSTTGSMGEEVWLYQGQKKVPSTRHLGISVETLTDWLHHQQPIE